MFRNLLVGVDGSATAQRALSEAIDLALASNARLTILVAVPPLPPFVAAAAAVDVGRLEREVEAESAAVLRAALDRVPPEIPVTHRLAHGSAGEAIVAEVDRGGHDLVVLGSRGRGRMTTFTLGSTGAYVHFHSSVAMLVVHPDPDADADAVVPSPLA
jgi:nucleotide-binding universal stress UspA family protein